MSFLLSFCHRDHRGNEKRKEKIKWHLSFRTYSNSSWEAKCEPEPWEKRAAFYTHNMWRYRYLKLGNCLFQSGDQVLFSVKSSLKLSKSFGQYENRGLSAVGGGGISPTNLRKSRICTCILGDQGAVSGGETKLIGQNRRESLFAHLFWLPSYSSPLLYSTAGLYAD